MSLMQKSHGRNQSDAPAFAPFAFAPIAHGVNGLDDLHGENKLECWSDGVMTGTQPNTPILDYSNSPFLPEGVLLCWKFFVFHVINKGFHRAQHYGFKISIPFDEFWYEIIEQAQHVVNHQHLAIATNAGTDPDGRNRETPGDFLGQIHRHAFQHDRERAGFFHRQRIAQYRLASLLVAALNFITTKLMYGLRREADMAHDRDAGLHERFDGFAHRYAAFEFHRLGAAFLKKTSGVCKRLLFAHLIRQKRHVADDECAFASPHNHASVVDHFVHGHGQSIRITLDNTP